MTYYLLSVHTVAGEVGEPMSNEQMQRTRQQLQVIEQSMKSGGRLGLLRPPARTRHDNRGARVRWPVVDDRWPVRRGKGASGRLLHHSAPTPVIALNRAVAIAEVQGAEAALALLEELELDSYYAFHAARADLLNRLGRHTEAAAAYARAAALAPTPAEREFLRLGGRSTRRTST